MDETTTSAESGRATAGRFEKLGRRTKKLALVGPAIVIGGLQFGPGNTVSAATVGATQGYRAIWLIALSTLLMLVYTDMAVRIGLALRVSPVRAIKESLGSIAGLLVGVCFFPIAVLFMTGSLIGTSLGLTVIFGQSVELWTVVSAVVALGLFWARHAYGRIEKAMVVAVATMVVVFGVTAIMARPDWGAVAAGFVPGSISGGGVAVFALLGTNLSIAAAFYAAYAIREKGTSREQYRSTTLVDTLPGVIIPGVMTILIIVAGAAVAHGQEITSADDLARILAPTIGIGASIIFAIGIFAAGFSSVIGNAASGGSILADGLGVGNSLRSRWGKACGAAVLLCGVGMVLLFGGAPVQLLILANALTIFVFPFLGAALLYLANSRSRMGNLKNSVWQNLLGVGAWLLMVWGAIELTIELF